MDLNEIRAFVAVAETGSVNRAAHEMRRSQPAVTRQIQRLEQALGIQVLDRRAKPAKLTLGGQVALERCRRILAAVEELRAATTLGPGPQGECRIGLAYSLAEMSLAGPLEKLRHEFPHVSFRVSTGWSLFLLEEIQSGTLDLAVVQIPEGHRPPAGVEGRMIRTERLVFVASSRRRLPRIVKLTDVAEETWVLNPDGCGFRAALRRALEDVNAPLRVAVEAYGMELHLSLVARGVGLGVLPTWVLARSPLRAKVRPFRVRGHEFRVAVWTLRGRLPEPLLPVWTALDEHLTRELARPTRSRR